MQSRLVYSLLKPAVTFAARFGIPIKSLVELLRLAYFELLAKAGHTQKEIAEQFGQSERHMRSLAQRLRSDFFQSEREIGLTREIEDALTSREMTFAQLRKKFSTWEDHDIRSALSRLEEDARIVRSQRGYSLGAKYSVLQSLTFQNRIDALNHFQDTCQHVISERLISDNRETAMLKTISFSSRHEDVAEFLLELEGLIRAKVAALEEKGAFLGDSNQRFSLSLIAAPSDAGGQSIALAKKRR